MEVVQTYMDVSEKDDSYSQAGQPSTFEEEPEDKNGNGT